MNPVDYKLRWHGPATAPAAFDWRQTAALPLVGITAWEGLGDKARVQPGDKMLGWAGGVGHVAIQLAKARGAHVAAAVSSPAKADIVRALGTDAVVRYREETSADCVGRLTDGHGFDLVLDAARGDSLNSAMAPARPNGQAVTIVASQQYDLTPAQSRA
ncbi:MAG: zinc-binding dehydrogenase [Permianibacter sp.]